MQNRQFIFEPKIQYALTAERSEATVSTLQFPKWCPRQESNLHYELRRPVFYPLNYEDYMVPPAGIEPALRVPQTRVLSIKLRGVATTLTFYSSNSKSGVTIIK